jgi:hypothetical protein
MSPINGKDVAEDTTSVNTIVPFEHESLCLFDPESPTKKQKNNNSDDDDDMVPFSTLMKLQPALSSEGEDENIPLALIILTKKANVVVDVGPVHKGETCIGLEVARILSSTHGVCRGQ